MVGRSSGLFLDSNSAFEPKNTETIGKYLRTIGTPANITTNHIWDEPYNGCLLKIFVMITQTSYISSTKFIQLCLINRQAFGSTIFFQLSSVSQR
jgi:hypothetical protein